MWIIAQSEAKIKPDREGMVVKIASWNVNSLRVRLEQLIDWLLVNQPDIVALQETKVTDALFPLSALQDAGYQACFSGEKTYNGVALLSRQPLDQIETCPEGWGDEQKRMIRASMNQVRLINLYVPNGSEVGSDKYRYKLHWMRNMRDLLAQELQQHDRVVVMGDFNLAPEDRDVYDPALWEGKVLCSAAEREEYHGWLELGLSDAFRLFDQDEASFSWWDYRAAGFRRNHGLRIDHVLVSEGIRQQCRGCWIDSAPRKLERPSDHAPVMAEFYF